MRPGTTGRRGNFSCACAPTPRRRVSGAGSPTSCDGLGLRKEPRHDARTRDRPVLPRARRRRQFHHASAGARDRGKRRGADGLRHGGERQGGACAGALREARRRAARHRDAGNVRARDAAAPRSALALQGGDPVLAGGRRGRRRAPRGVAPRSLRGDRQAVRRRQPRHPRAPRLRDRGDRPARRQPSRRGDRP